jgi:7-cyano-7-deazaguanine reductase
MRGAISAVRGDVQLWQERTMPDYTDEHASAGVHTRLPELETWPNQYPGYTITTKFPEYSSVCPKTGMPDYGCITIEYVPREKCIELKALKLYLLAYRNLGIFYENAVNKMLRDIVAAVEPELCEVRGDFTPRGGLTTSVVARWPLPGSAGSGRSASKKARGKR